MEVYTPKVYHDVGALLLLRLTARIVEKHEQSPIPFCATWYIPSTSATKGTEGMQNPASKNAEKATASSSLS